MANEQQDNVWPLPKFYFSADFGAGIEAPFQEVTGLDSETRSTEFGHRERSLYHERMPRAIGGANVTLRKGVFRNDAAFSAWRSRIGQNADRSTIRIRLLDESGKIKMIWTLHNAYPTRMTGADLGSGNEVAVESIELAFETMLAETPQEPSVSGR